MSEEHVDTSSDRFRISGADVSLLLAALIGSGVAALADITQKPKSGVFAQIKRSLADELDLSLKAYWYMLALMVLGAALCFIFQPKTRQAAFGIGLSVISVLMTAIPVTPPNSPATIVSTGNTPVAPGPSGIYVPSGTLPWLISSARAETSISTNSLRLNFLVRANSSQPRSPGAITIRARELPSGRTWEWNTDQFERQTSFPLNFFYEVPASANIQTIEVQLESEHYESCATKVAVASNSRQVAVNCDLDPSRVPNFLKQLLR